jgi:hypothetical protein
MPTDCTGLWYLDGIDLWTGFKTAIANKSTNQFLKYAPKKSTIEYEWTDVSGTSVDTTTPLYAARTIVLECAIFCDTTAEFFDNYTALINQLMLPGLHNIKIVNHENRIYSVEYKETGSYVSEKGLKIDGTSYNIHRFTITVREPEPNPGSTTSRIIDQDGRYIIT